MKKKLVLCLMSLLFLTTIGCGYKSMLKIVKKPYSVEEAVQWKLKLDKARNPVAKELAEEDILREFIEIEDAKVDLVEESNNVYYDFCIISKIKTSQGVVNCYIYTKDRRKLAKLVAGESHVHVLGYFGRFFNYFGEENMNLEILDCDLKILSQDDLKNIAEEKEKIKKEVKK